MGILGAVVFLFFLFLSFLLFSFPSFPPPPPEGGVRGRAAARTFFFFSANSGREGGDWASWGQSGFELGWTHLKLDRFGTQPSWPIQSGSESDRPPPSLSRHLPQTGLVPNQTNRVPDSEPNPTPSFPRAGIRDGTVPNRPDSPRPVSGLSSGPKSDSDSKLRNYCGTAGPVGGKCFH